MIGRTSGYVDFETVKKSTGASYELAKEMEEQLNAFLQASDKLADSWSGNSRETFMKIYPQIAETWKSCIACMDSLGDFIQIAGQQEYNKMQEIRHILRVKG